MTVCHLNYAKREEQNNDDDMNSSDQMDIDTDCMYTDCTNADCITKDCINAKFNYANCISTNRIIQICTVPIHMI